MIKEASSGDGERIPRDEGGHKAKSDQDHGPGWIVTRQRRLQSALSVSWHDQQG
jgi:hypothetical protein